MVPAVLSVLLAIAAQTSPPQAPVRPATVVPAQTASRPATPARVYDAAADAKTAVESAIKSAHVDGIRVLINWGTNGDSRCDAFQAVLRTQDVIATHYNADEYRIVNIDVGHADRNLDLAKRFGATIALDVLPALTVLDDTGQIVANVSTTSLMVPDSAAFDPKKVAAFFTTHQAPAPDAIAPFEAAVKQAKKDGKVVFVWFSAPW